MIKQFVLEKSLDHSPCKWSIVLVSQCICSGYSLPYRDLSKYFVINKFNCVYDNFLLLTHITWCISDFLDTAMWSLNAETLQILWFVNIIIKSKEKMAWIIFQRFDVLLSYIKPVVLLYWVCKASMINTHPFYISWSSGSLVCSWIFSFFHSLPFYFPLSNRTGQIIEIGVNTSNFLSARPILFYSNFFEFFLDFSNSVAVLTLCHQ